MGEIAPKKRVRYHSHGWFRYCTDIMFGLRDWHSGNVVPDSNGRTGKGEIWVGPFNSFDEAVDWKQF